MRNLQGLIRNEAEFPKGDQENIKLARISRGLGFWPCQFQGIPFSRDRTQFCGVFRVGALFCLEFPGEK